MILQPASRYPADPRAIFILAMSVFVGFTALALDAAPASMNAILPRWGVLTWGVVLALGSALALFGMALQTVNGIIVEQIGSVTVGAATIFYSTLAFIEVGPDALQTVGMILGWGLACLIRWAQLQYLIRDSIRRAQKLEFLSRMEASLQAWAETHPGRRR